jgi:hypothetical protein
MSFLVVSSLRYEQRRKHFMIVPVYVAGGVRSSRDGELATIHYARKEICASLFSLITSRGYPKSLGRDFVGKGQ